MRFHSRMGVWQSLPNTIAVPHLIVTANHRPSLVYRAQHGVPVQGCAPAIVETRHDPSIPLVLFRQFGRNVVVTHQHHLQPAAAGFARAARDDRAIARFCCVVFCIHPLIFPNLTQPSGYTSITLSLYLATVASWVTNLSGSVRACATSMRSKGSACMGGNVSVAAACSAVTGSRL